MLVLCWCCVSVVVVVVGGGGGGGGVVFFFFCCCCGSLTHVTNDRISKVGGPYHPPLWRCHSTQAEAGSSKYIYIYIDR